MIFKLESAVYSVRNLTFKSCRHSVHSHLFSIDNNKFLQTEIKRTTITTSKPAVTDTELFPLGLTPHDLPGLCRVLVYGNLSLPTVLTLEEPF
jgi:hypothetical protein